MTESTNWHKFLGGTPEATPPARPPTATENRLVAPKNRLELTKWVSQYCGLRLPERAVCPWHQTPLDYLEYVFFEQPGGDPLVWACRGGGKTVMAAVATLLDLLFKPGIEVRLLGGSATQSERMYQHLVGFVRAGFVDQIFSRGRRSAITQQGFIFRNGSRVELLGQSESSVRGARVQKVRCDEVDLFTPEVWNAVQLTTRSKPRVRGSIEAFSTMNGPTGVMGKLIGDMQLPGTARRRMFCWCVWDVIERCNEKCAECSLRDDCLGSAHAANGFIPVEDVRVMKSRVDERTWRYEMLCDPAFSGHRHFYLKILRY